MRLPGPAPLSAEQADLEARMASRRGRLEVYRTLLHHPRLASRVSDLGEALRFEGCLPDDLRELAILAVARRLDCPYEAAQHREPARRAGVPEGFIETGSLDALDEGRRRVVEAVEYALDRVSLPAELHEALVRDVGLAGVVELVVLAGFYGLLAGVVGCFEVPLPLEDLPSLE